MLIGVVSTREKAEVSVLQGDESPNNGRHRRNYHNTYWNLVQGNYFPSILANLYPNNLFVAMMRCFG